MTVEQYFRSPGLPESWRAALLKKVAIHVSPDVQNIHTEFCFNVQLSKDLNNRETDTLRWLLAETFQPEKFSNRSFLQPIEGQILEVGPRLSFSTA
ncbi:MAG: hypothetical protein DRJ65_10965, partial [Acidobacteria bacterium]